MAGTSLIEGDDVRDRSKGHEQGKSGALGCPDSGSSWTTGEVDDWGTGVRGGAFEANERQLDQVALGIASFFRNEQRSKFSSRFLAFAVLKAIRFDFQASGFLLRKRNRHVAEEQNDDQDTLRAGHTQMPP